MLEDFYTLVGRDADPILWWQMCLRAVIIFVWAVALYRGVPRRAFGNNSAVDIVVVVVMGSMLSRAITGTAPLLPVIAASAVLAVLYSAVIVASSRLRPLSKLVKGRSHQLIRDGRIDRHAMHKAQIGEGDLRESLRQQGFDELDEVESAYLERNGKVSVIRRG